MDAMFYDICSQMKDGSSRSATSLTEDAIAQAPYAIMVMDGATVVNGDENHFFEVSSDASWLSHAGCSRLMELFGEVTRNSEKMDIADIEAAIQNAIISALDELQAKYEKATGRDCRTLTPADVPSSSLSCALLAGGNVFLMQLGDSPITVRRKDGSVLYMAGDARLIGYDETNKEKIGELVRSGMPIADAHKAMSPAFHEVRRIHCNNARDDSYKIFCFCGKEYALPRIEVLNASDVESVVVFSDGLADLLAFEDELGAARLHDMCIDDMAGAFKRLGAYQEADSDCTRLFRFKKSDDIAAVAAKVLAGEPYVPNDIEQP